MSGEKIFSQGEEQVVMEGIFDVLAHKMSAYREQVKQLLSRQAGTVIDNVTVAQVYGGMRGVKALVCDTSRVDPDLGLLVRGTPIADLADRLPEEVFHFLLTSELPEEAGCRDLQKELSQRGTVPEYVWDVLSGMAPDSHPMSMLSTAIVSMQRESVFSRRYDEGMDRDDHWKATLEDSLNLLARLPVIAAGIYRMRFGKGERVPADPNLDWAANFAHMLGIDDPTGEFKKLMRLYMVVHCDHEGGNVSAHACNLVGSALSDIYYSVSAGLNGLAGPLHGLANQECLKFLLSVREEFGKVPDEEDLEEFVWKRLRNRQVIPGYGHAVLRCTDPRFLAFLEFGKRACPADPIFQLVDSMYRVVPGVLKGHGKAKSPYPNVDAGSGSLLHHFGLTEFSFYTVLFSVSRALGLCAQSVLNRGLASPIERPKSVSTGWIEEETSSGAQG